MEMVRKSGKYQIKDQTEMPKQIVVCWKVHDPALSFALHYVTDKKQRHTVNFVVFHINHSPPMKMINNNN